MWDKKVKNEDLKVFQNWTLQACLRHCETCQSFWWKQLTAKNCWLFSQNVPSYMLEGPKYPLKHNDRSLIL